MRYRPLIGALLLSACTSPERLRPDVEAWQPPSRLEEIAYINALRDAFIFIPATADPLCHDGSGTGYFRPSLSQGLPEHQRGQEQARRADSSRPADDPGTGVCVSYKPSPQPPEIRRYLEAGFGLSDVYCQRYFVVATQSRLKRRFARNAFSSVDTLVGSILSLTAVGATATGIVNGAFGLVDSTFQNVDDSFLVAADLENVRSLVQAAQDAYRAEAVRAQALATSYPAARSVIERYAGICSYTGMRRLVNASVNAQSRQLDQQTPRPDTPAPNPNPNAGAVAAAPKPAPAPAPAARPEAMVSPPPVGNSTGS
jgi:hypothetical protein